MRGEFLAAGTLLGDALTVTDRVEQRWRALRARRTDDRCERLKRCRLEAMRSVLSQLLGGRQDDHVGCLSPLVLIVDHRGHRIDGRRAEEGRDDPEATTPEPSSGRRSYSGHASATLLFWTRPAFTTLMNDAIGQSERAGPVW